MKTRKVLSDFMPEFEEAQQIMLDHIPASRVKRVPLSSACGLTLAESILVKIDSPPFHQSAMDGFAFNFSKWDKISPLIISNEIPAGKFLKESVRSNGAVRIFTGAAVPAGADTVVVQEKVVEKNGQIVISDPFLLKGANIRKQGSHVKSGKTVWRKGQRLTVGAIGFLASLGVSTVKVYALPIVSIIVTGDELTIPGKVLKRGHVFECNSYGLTAALSKVQITPRLIIRCADDPNQLEKDIKKALKVSDILILTGGVSVGDYDFVADTLKKCGVIKKFHNVRQKPGKPLYFGLKGNKLVFGLPGNPASVLSCYYSFVVKAISSFSKLDVHAVVTLPAMNSFLKKGTLTTLLKARTSARGVEILHDQESYKLNSFAEADGLVVLPPEKQEVLPGDLLKVLLMDN